MVDQLKKYGLKLGDRVTREGYTGYLVKFQGDPTVHVTILKGTGMRGQTTKWTPEWIKYEPEAKLKVKNMASKQTPVDILERIPENSIIHSNDYVSSWNGYLAIVFSGMGFNAEKLSSGYMIEYITGDDNEPIKIDDTNEWMIGKPIRRMSGDAKAIDNYPRGILYIRTPETIRVWIKKNVKELNSEEMAKYANHLSEIGYIDNTDWQISKTAWLDLFKNGFDELENKDSDSANKIYEMLRFKFGRDFDAVRSVDSTVKTIKGVYTLSKADLKHRIYTLKWIVENKKGNKTNKNMNNSKAKAKKD